MSEDIDPVAGNASEPIGMGETIRLLQRYEQIERVLMRIGAGWAMATTNWNVKVTLGRHIWQDAQRAQRWRLRLKELRSGPLGPDNNTGLTEVADYAARANHTAEYIAGMYGVLKSDLLRTYLAHESWTCSALDDATLEALRLNRVSLAEQCTWAEGVASFGLIPAFDSAEAKVWSGCVLAKLQQAGGIDGRQQAVASITGVLPERSPFKRPHSHRVDGFQMKKARDKFADGENQSLQRQHVFRNFMNEIGAGDNVASIVYDAPPTVQWEFLHDMARHAWDEYRHATMGLTRLRKLGYDPAEFPLGYGVFEFRDALTIVDRLGMLVFIDEADSFEYKRENREIFERMSDETSVQNMLFDISDETRHVANGHKWIAHLQEVTGDKRSRETLMIDLRRLLEERIAFMGSGSKN